MDPLLILLSALLLDALVGDPDVVWRRVPHPVVYFGRLIGWLDGTLNREDRGPAWRRVAGMGALVTLLSVAIGVGVGLESALALVSFGWVLEVVVLAVFLAQKSLYDHVARVAQGLKEEGLAGGRAAVSQIVGRDPEQLDAPLSAGRRSKLWPRTSPTVWSRLSSGTPSAVCRGCWPTRPSIRRTA